MGMKHGIAYFLGALMVSLWFVRCGGSVVTEEGRAGAAGDASSVDVADAGDKDSSFVLLDASQLDGPHDVEIDRPPWNGKCLCRNWSDTHYPTDVYSDGNCVQGPECPPGTVCCAGPCVSTDICEWRQGNLSEEVCKKFGYYERGWCCPGLYQYTMCVPADKCAPEGVLERIAEDPETVSFDMCRPE